MFKFMKSKKGFSLVELMIVVVIMAILVAVAVPIFNSVTGNSRAKTCIDNQRSIISTLNTALLEKTVTDDNELTFYVNNDAVVPGEDEEDEDVKYTKGYYGADYAAFPSGEVFSEDEISGLFQTVPYCPVDNSSIEVIISANSDGTATITTKCLTNGVDSGVTKDVHALS